MPIENRYKKFLLYGRKVRGGKGRYCTVEQNLKNLNIRKYEF